MTRIGSTAYVALILDLSPSVVRMSPFIASTEEGLPGPGDLVERHVRDWDVAARQKTSNKLPLKSLVQSLVQRIISFLLRI